MRQKNSTFLYLVYCSLSITPTVVFQVQQLYIIKQKKKEVIFLHIGLVLFVFILYDIFKHFVLSGLMSHWPCAKDTASNLH